jgi:hypothetical protein
MKVKPTLLLYGNCQADALSVIFRSDALVTATFTVAHVPSFDDRSPGRVDVAPGVIASTAVLFEQNDPNPFPHRNLLPSSCVTVIFPSIDLNLLWPMQCANEYNEPPSPEYPWGRFPYGDRVIIDCVKRGLSVRETLEYYEASFTEHLMNLDRFERHERSRLLARDEKCDVTMGSFIMDRFRSENLFWAVNHPTMRPLRELCTRLVAKVTPFSSAFADVELDKTIALLPPQGPLGDFRIPIHPHIARHLGLEWFPNPSSKEYGPRAARLTYHEYLAQMVECAVAVRDSVSVSSST